MEERNISTARATSSVRVQNPPGQRRRILVVDDEADIRQISAEVLRHAGYQVDAAEDGAVAWEALQQNRYDLMVTDNRMPKVSGLELITKIRAARLPLPVLMATGAFPLDEVTKYPWLQPVAMLNKPYTNGELLTAVQQVLHAIDRAPKVTVTPPNWRSRSPAEARQ